MLDPGSIVEQFEVVKDKADSLQNLFIVDVNH